MARSTDAIFSSVVGQPRIGLSVRTEKLNRPRSLQRLGLPAGFEPDVDEHS